MPCSVLSKKLKSLHPNIHYTVGWIDFINIHEIACDQAVIDIVKRSLLVRAEKISKQFFLNYVIGMRVFMKHNVKQI